MMYRRTLIFLGLSVAGALLPTASPADRDHDQAFRAVERGEALPLFDILARVRDRLGGEVVHVAFKRRHDRWLYEFKVIAAGGQLTEIYVDAATAAIVEREEH